MLRLLRLKNINRFRPQNQQSLGITRLIDIKDAEKHWDSIEQEMRSMLNGKKNNCKKKFLYFSFVFIDNEEVNVRSSISSVSTENSKASTVERVEINEPPSSEISVQINKGEKRSLDEPLDEEDIPVLERINKRVKFTEKENNERLIGKSNGEKTKINEQSTDKIHKKRTIKLSKSKNNKKRLVPSTRTNKQSISTWAKKYNIEDCCIQLKQYDPIYDTGTD
jgi:hypothetical protein